jgi:HTH-type transcriptional regulator, sugar sensing transcriptional regulator
MDKGDIFGLIRKAGFSEYETKCYLALLERDSLTVNEIAKLADIPRPSAYDVLDKLMEKGLVTAIASKTKRYSAGDPGLLKQLALADLMVDKEIIEKKKWEIIEREKDIHKYMEIVVDKLVPSFRRNKDNGSPLDYIEIVKGPHANHRKFIELCSRASQEILAFAKPPFAFTTKDDLHEQASSQGRTSDNPITIKTVYEFTDSALAKYPLLLDHINMVTNGSDEVRVIDNLPMKMVIFDDKTVFLMLEDPIEGKISLTGIIIEHHALALGLKMLFYSIWEKAKDYYVLNDGKHYIPNPKKEQN